MTRERTWSAKAIYVLVALALAIGLTMAVAPARTSADPGLSEWSKVSTPSMKDWVLAPNSQIIHYAPAAGGNVIYVVGNFQDKDDLDGDGNKDEVVPQLLKSTDGAATWKNYTDKILKTLSDKGLGDLTALLKVSCDPVNSDFVAVALASTVGGLRVFVSENGGTTFKDTGDVRDGTAELAPAGVMFLTVSMEVNGQHDIAISGQGTKGGATVGLVFRFKTGLGAGWEDATKYPGWDNYGAFTSVAVPWVRFAVSWPVDNTVLVTSVTAYGGMGTIYLQTGTWGRKEGWNEEVTFPPAVPIKSGVYIPTLSAATAGITMPLDYQGRYSSKRIVWVFVNYISGTTKIGEIYRVDNDAAAPILQQVRGKPWLANVSYWGYIESGKAVASLMGDGTGALTACCEGVQVYRNDGITDMEICCLAWKPACKPPTGRGSMAAFYITDKKVYAVAVGPAPAYDESAWSVSFDNGYTFNQLSLIDTNIDYLTDVAVSPNCNKTMLVSVNVDSGCGCDSVWLKAEDLAEASEYSGKWLRTWCGQLANNHGLLRLAPEEVNGETVYLVDRGTDTVYWNNLETLGCWEEGHATVSNIVDLAVKDEATIYALDKDGDVAMSDDHGATATWGDPVDSKVREGWTIAVLGNNILVGPVDDWVSYSSDGGATFTKLEETTRVMGTSGYVTVAFDSYFNANKTIYAAVIGGNNGIYRWVIGESKQWKNLGAEPYGYTGLVLDRPAPGNPMTSAATGGVLYASYVTSENGQVVTGVARCLKPAEEICCGEADWDYLVQGLTPDKEAFYLMPKALKICGCLEATSNSKLFAIDGIYDTNGPGYDMSKAGDGTVWTYEDCYAKGAPTLVSPADGATIPSDACYCWNKDFVLTWERQCDACSYDIQIALDRDFREVIYDIRGYEPPKGVSPSYLVRAGNLTCDQTYYWRVRSADAETGEKIHSWWSQVRSFTVATGPQAGVRLTAPEAGATDVPVTKVGFTWSTVQAADSYDFVLSKNADLSSPIETKTGLKATAYTYTGTLEYSTTYYWQVTAKKGTAVISQSNVGTFTTVAATKYCCPQDGLCFATEAELKAHYAEVHGPPPTPFWVWVAIAIGAVLVIVVIVLIFRTRRV